RRGRLLVCFFQAEDGIRDFHVTGVQTCALPISSYPSRVFKGMRMAGRMGGDRVKVKSLRIVKIFNDKNYILVTGSVPGHNGSIEIGRASCRERLQKPAFAVAWEKRYTQTAVATR